MVDNLPLTSVEKSSEIYGDLELSVVMPCLNEEVTVGICIRKAMETMARLGIKGEVVISDNGSTDRSVEIAENLGARVVHQPQKGYGNAYIMGLHEAKGRFIVMADSDDSYDLTELERFIKPLREGYDMVMGSRLKGEIKPGAMSAMHRFGNPLLSGFLNLLYRTGISDAHCGMRAFTRDALQKMHLQTEGMEFASEMVIKASKARLKITEIPITLHPDGRERRPHLRTFRDGWRHLRFMLMYSPVHLFGYLGWTLFLLGAALFAIYIFNGTVSQNLGLISGLVGLAGWVITRFGFYARAHQFTLDFPNWDLPLQRFFSRFSLERSLILGVLRFLLGLVVLYLSTRAPVVLSDRFLLLGAMVATFGILTIFDAFLTRILQFEGLK